MIRGMGWRLVRDKPLPGRQFAGRGLVYTPGY